MSFKNEENKKYYAICIFIEWLAIDKKIELEQRNNIHHTSFS